MMINRATARDLRDQARTEIDKIAPTAVHLFLRQYPAPFVDIVCRPVDVGPAGPLPARIIGVTRAPGLRHSALTVVSVGERRISRQVTRLIVGEAGVGDVVA